MPKKINLSPVQVSMLKRLATGLCVYGYKTTITLCEFYCEIMDTPSRPREVSGVTIDILYRNGFISEHDVTTQSPRIEKETTMLEYRITELGKTYLTELESEIVAK